MTGDACGQGDRWHGGQSEWGWWEWLCEHNALSVAFLQRLLTESLQVFTNVGGATGKKCDSATMAPGIPFPRVTIPSLFCAATLFHCIAETSHGCVQARGMLDNPRIKQHTTLGEVSRKAGCRETWATRKAFVRFFFYESLSLWNPQINLDSSYCNPTKCSCWTKWLTEF